MAKDPAFLFYPGDWNLGTMHLTLLEKGCYMELLILQFAKGKFTEAQAKHMLNGSFDLAWATISEKFKTDGKYYWNERLEKEKVIRQKFTQSRRDNASKPKKDKKQPKAYAKHMDKRMENENKDEITTKYACYNAEEYILGNQIAFERICMAVSKKEDEVKAELHKYHLWMAKNEKYPLGKGAVEAGIESWILNANDFKKAYNGTNNNAANNGTTRFNAGAQQLLEQLKGKTAT